MNCTVTIDWKFVVACGAAAALVIFAKKMNAAEATEVLTHAVDAYKERAVALEGEC